MFLFIYSKNELTIVKITVCEHDEANSKMIPLSQQENWISSLVYYLLKLNLYIHYKNQTHMIKITDLEKIYRTEEVETVALNKLSLEVKEGEFVAVMGPSGCGKSTLLNIVGLLDDPDGGSFKFNGIEVAKFNERKGPTCANEISVLFSKALI